MPPSRKPPKIVIPGADDVFAASKKRADAAAQNLKMARLIGKPFPPGWEEGTHFATGTKDTVWKYNEMVVVRGKFARILAHAPDEDGMIGVETRNAVADAMGTAELRHLGPVILGKLTGGSLDEACLHYNIV
eukprot:CAMPEP_0173088394 /NCGR_PEP_ID=MMETSP1102-20130122/24902_1 /TAXON_ID=49646 /ORGANISM="Geminigera sp., Strain Caron Lab Isolate" /LENGTH=131 /DNA_ID=CAMNT_0013971277 /DNA_START=317 /DNA_END=712 /DNA_ORIENTATION=+